MRAALVTYQLPGRAQALSKCTRRPDSFLSVFVVRVVTLIRLLPLRLVFFEPLNLILANMPACIGAIRSVSTQKVQWCDCDAYMVKCSWYIFLQYNALQQCTL